MANISGTEQIETPVLEKVLNPEEIKNFVETAISDIQAIKKRVKELAPDATSTNGTVGGMQYTYSETGGAYGRSERLSITNWEETNNKEIVVAPGNEGVHQRPLLSYTEFRREKPGEPAKEKTLLENTDKAAEKIKQVLNETRDRLGLTLQQVAA
ncbi:MAG: hypothetical protein Q8Q15_02200 [bacterium]|nr:hypothetical protein [bacterium]